MNATRSMKIKRNQSFTLVEALLAVTIMGLSITSILTTFSASLVAIRTSQDYALVATLFEELKTHVRANLFSPTEMNQGNFTNHPEFTWQVEYYYSDITGVYQVQMVIAWERGTRNYTVRYDTYQFIPETSSELESESESGGGSGGR